MSRERSNTDDIMEAMEFYKAPRKTEEVTTAVVSEEVTTAVAAEACENVEQDSSMSVDSVEREQSQTTTSTNCAAFDEIVLDWNSLFGQADCDIEVAQLGLKGLLRGCPYRSVCWKLFLGILPEDRRLWCKEMKRHRKEYEEVHRRYLSDPRLQSPRADATVNNPLSLDTESPWNKYFQDEELRATIVRDVERTFPEVDYFQGETVQAMLTDILFCYCHVHASLGYRQGMHELLAIFLLVLDCDKRDSTNISQDDPWAVEMLVLLDADSVEADAYVLFSALMATSHLWFEQTKAVNDDGLDAKTPLVKKLERIQDHLLGREDPVLHAHLQKYSILPQLYALRWVRLLFSREFPLLDVLVLWDAILAYSPNLDLVDYVTLAMLLIAREPLLMGNETSSIGLLLNYPRVPDIHFVVQKALFLRNPKVYPRPPNWQLEDTSTSRAPVLPSGALKNRAEQLTQGARSLAEKVGSSAIAKLKNIPTTRSRQDGSPRSPPRKATTNLSQRLRLATSRSNPTGASTPVTSSGGSGGGTGSNSATSLSLDTGSAHQATGAANWSDETSLSPGPSMDIVAQDSRSVHSPSVELTRLQASCIRCSRHMNLYLRVLQSDVLTLHLPEECEDRVLRSVAGLKQIRDVLCGVLTSDEVQFQSLDGLTLPDGLGLGPMFDYYVDEAADGGAMSPVLSDHGNDGSFLSQVVEHGERRGDVMGVESTGHSSAGGADVVAAAVSQDVPVSATLLHVSL